MDLVFKSASELARMIREKEVSSSEVLEAYLAQIKEHNTKLNAIVTLDEAGARKRAREADEALARGEVWGSLHGVPMTVKDVFETKDILTTVGFYEDYIPTQDTTFVKKLKDAGVIIFGKTNVPAFGNDGQTNNILFGYTNNPWEDSRTVGGSSGGAAAAVAAGMTSFELGSDFCGSIRIPAHYCGVYGYKCTAKAMIPRAKSPKPIMPGTLMREMTGYGCLARSVEDLKLTAQVLYDETAPISFNPANKEFKDLKIAYIDHFDGIPISTEISEGVNNFAERLKAAGCKVEKAEPKSFNYFSAVKTSFELFAALDVKPAVLKLIPKAIFKRIVESLTSSDNPVLRGYIGGMKYGFKECLELLEKRDEFIYKLEDFLSEYDAWICPSASTPAFPHVNTLSMLNRLKEKIECDGRLISYPVGVFGHANVFTFTGSPVVNLPIGFSKEKLPIGAQLVGRKWRDLELLNVAEQIEKTVIGKLNKPF